jgi:AcrR family transcriptional regulator
MPAMSSAATVTSNRKVSAIVEAAVAAFSEQGFAAARIADIADAAGVGKGTVYEYFRTKEELLLAACEHACIGNNSAVEAALGGSVEDLLRRDDPIAVLTAMMATVTEIVVTRMQKHLRLYSDLATSSREQPVLMRQAQARLQTLYQGWESGLVLIYEQGLAAGIFRPVADRALLARMYLSLVDGLVWQLSWRQDRTARDLARNIAGIFVGLLSVEPAKKRVV